MHENVDGAGEKVERFFLIKEHVAPPYLERERRFEDAESAARPRASQKN
jgi:hypothetical protein